MVVRRPLRLCALFAAVLVTCLLAVTFFRSQEDVAALWPADALVLAFMLRACRDWGERLTALALGLAAMALANFLGGQPVLMAALLPLGNGAGILLAAWLLRRLRLPPAGLKDFMHFFLVAVVLAPVVAAALGVSMLLVLSPEAEPLRSFLRWSVSVGVGMAVVAPFALSLGDWRSYFGSDRRSLAQGALAQLTVVAVALYVFVLAPVPFPIVILPAIILAVFTHRDLGGALAMAVTSGIALTADVLGLGNMRWLATELGRDPVLMIQGSIAVMALTVHPIVAVLKQLDALMADQKAQREMAERESRNKTKLLAHVSHEIRTPLSGVVTLAEMMKSGAMGELTPRQREIVARIADSGAEIECLSRDLLDAAAIQSGKAAVQIGPVNVATVLQEAIGAAMFRARDYKAVIWCADDIDPGLHVAADAQRLRQILLNLIVNAAKYGGKPPVVRLDAVRTASGAVRLQVADNGPGIPPERRANLFRAFDRLGAEQTSVEGTGVGLALARELAELQGGDLGLDEELGELGGACFWVELPVWSQAAAA